MMTVHVSVASTPSVGETLNWLISQTCWPKFLKLEGNKQCSFMVFLLIRNNIIYYITLHIFF